MTNYHDVEILLVEDDPDDAGLAIRALQKSNLGNKLVHLTDGAEALDFVFANGKYTERKVDDKPRVILLDLKMPKVDGFQVLKALKSDERTKYIPVVVMTSSNHDKDIVESYKLGVNSYIVKPLEFESFKKIVTELGLYWIIANKSPK
ncbi:MAG TPA: response regulator [Bacteroidia bacterium]|jgi:two-component system response regulator|nr:response regulator [Bacteroidia bacterium]